MLRAYENADGNMSKVVNDVMLAEDGTCVHPSHILM